MRRLIWLPVVLLFGCGVSLAEIGTLGLKVTARTAQCQAERATGPKAAMPKCDAATLCSGAAGVVIMSESPTRAQLTAATTLCGGP